MVTLGAEASAIKSLVSVQISESIGVSHPKNDVYQDGLCLWQDYTTRSPSPLSFLPSSLPAHPLQVSLSFSQFLLGYFHGQIQPTLSWTQHTLFDLYIALSFL